MERNDPTTTTPTCGDCAHAHIVSDELGKRMCRRYPPTVFPVQAGPGQLAGVTLRPEVRTTDHACGEFKPKH